MFNFKKKLFFVVLSTLLLTLSLGLCGSCYAVENVGQIKNIVYNVLVNFANKDDTTASAFIENNESYFTQISSYCNENYYFMAIRDDNGYFEFMFEPVANFRKSAYVGSLGWYISYSKALRLQNPTNNPSLYFSNYGNKNQRMGTNTTYIYTEHDIYANTSGTDANTVVYSARYCYAVLV